MILARPTLVVLLQHNRLPISMQVMSQHDASTRWSGILGAAQGYPLSRDEFVRCYAHVIEAYLGARWRGSPLIAEVADSTQDVFVECLKENGALARADPGNRGGFRTYLFAIVRNVARRTEQKKMRRQEQKLPTDSSLPGGEEPANRAFDRAWAEAIMRQATRLMTENSRTGGLASQRRVELLRLRFTEGQPTRRIAQDWGMKSAQIQYEYKCARDEFRAALIDVVRQHDPRGDVDEECVRLLAQFG